MSLIRCGVGGGHKNSPATESLEALLITSLLKPMRSIQAIDNDLFSVSPSFCVIITRSA